MNPILEIIKAALENQKFDGLYNNSQACACELSDLSPGSCLAESCRPGHYVECDDDCELAGEPPPHFHIGEKTLVPVDDPAESGGT